MQSFKTILHPTLFDNHKAVNSAQKRAMVVGDFFEEAASNLLNLKRLNLDPNQTACPDLVDANKSLYVESKAANIAKGSGVAIKGKQLRYYRDMRDLAFPSIYDGKPIFTIDIKYCLWFYSINKMLSEKVETIRERLANSVCICVIVDIEFIESLMSGLDEAVNKRKFRFDTILSNLKSYKESYKELDVYGVRTNKFLLIEETSGR